MIIDADCHISPVPLPGGSITFDELLRRMDRAGVDKALTWLQPPYTRHLDEANAYVHAAAQAHPDRILPFGWADPNLGVQSAIDMVHRCIDDYAFLGVKLNGAQNSFYIDDPNLSLPVVEAIAATGKLIAFHIGSDAFDATHPFRLAKIARQYPDLRILVVHMGGVGHQDMTNAVLEFARECPNMFLIGSAVRTGAILKAIDALGADRVCFGSDTPFELMHVEVARYQAMLSNLPEPDRERVMSGTIAKLCGT